MIFVIILYAVFAAMTFINTALMTSDPYPIIVGMFRAVGSGMIILGYLLLFDRQKLLNLRLTKHEWYFLALYGVLIHAFAMCGFSYGAMYASPITICFLYASAPFLTAIILYLDEKESLNWTKLVGLIVGLMGLIPILLKSSTMNHSLVMLGNALVGNGIVLISMLFFCSGWIFFKKLIHFKKHSIQLLNGIAMIIGGIVSTFIALVFYGKDLFAIPFSNNFSYLLGLFIVASLLTYSLYAYLLQHFSPTFISFAGFLEPAFAILYGMLFFGYSIQIIDIASFLILFAGLYIFYRQEL